MVPGFGVSGLGIEGYLTCWKDELGNHTLGMKAQNMHQQFLHKSMYEIMDCAGQWMSLE